jgi:PTS system nitrogen regulatory IIA component
MQIAEFIRAEHVVAGLQVADKAQLLGELARRAALALGYDGRTILDALIAREALGSTGIGHGIALPHSRLPGITQLFGLFARLDRPIDVGSIDGQPVDLVFLLLVPAHAGKEHLAALASVSRRLRNRDVVRAIRGARDAGALYTALAG